MRLTFHASILAAAMSVAMSGGEAAARDAERIDQIKQEIVALARSFRGQGDADFSRQRQLDVLVAELLEAAPQPPIAERLETLQGAWRQIWGPYDYRSSGARGVDPATDPDRIYQVVFPEGFYYNVAPRDVRDRGRNRQVALLRGAYAVAPGKRDMLKVRFTNFPTTRVRKVDDDLWRLAERAENGALENRSAVLPGFFVRLFFGGGGLREVYTDETMRITYGGRDLDDRADEFIYVMERVDRP